MNKIDQLQTDIGRWSDKTFGACVEDRREGLINHLIEEVEELHSVGDENNVKEELADVMILLLDVARGFGFTATYLLYATEDMLEKNRGRKWGEPDENGIVHHIEESSDE